MKINFKVRIAQKEITYVPPEDNIWMPIVTEGLNGENLLDIFYFDMDDDDGTGELTKYYITITDTGKLFRSLDLKSWTQIMWLGEGGYYPAPVIDIHKDAVYGEYFPIIMHSVDNNIGNITFSMLIVNSLRSPISTASSLNSTITSTSFYDRAIAVRIPDGPSFLNLFVDKNVLGIAYSDNTIVTVPFLPVEKIIDYFFNPANNTIRMLSKTKKFIDLNVSGIFEGQSFVDVLSNEDNYNIGDELTDSELFCFIVENNIGVIAGDNGTLGLFNVTNNEMNIQSISNVFNGKINSALFLDSHTLLLAGANNFAATVKVDAESLSISDILTENPNFNTATINKIKQIGSKIIAVGTSGNITTRTAL